MVNTQQTAESASGAAAPSLLRQMNQRLLLDRLYFHGASVRPQLARETGLSLPTVIAALGDLERAGLVRRSGRVDSAPGRPAAEYTADFSAGSVAGIDIGRGKLRLMITDLAGQPLSRLDVRNTAQTSDALVDLVEQSFLAAAAQAGLSPDQLTHTVIGSPGVFDPGRGQIRFAGNLPDWQREGLADALAERLGGALTIDNDANLAALGEHRFGAARGIDHFAYLTIGTGVGLGLVLDGRLYRGRGGAAGEVGFLPIADRSMTTRSSSTRQRGLLEEAVAADAFIRHAQQEGMDPSLTAEQIFAAARSGDERALRAIAAVSEYLAELIASIVAFLDPELIIVGGGIGQNLDLLTPHVDLALALLTPLQPTLAASELGTEAVVRGAIATGIAAARETVFTTLTTKV